MARAKTEDGEHSQLALVRMSLEELGPDAKPQAIQDHIKTKFNRDLTKSIISNYKFHLKKKGKRRGRPAGSAGPKAATATGGGSVRLDDLEVVRALVNRLGADQVKRLLAVMG